LIRYIKLGSQKESPDRGCRDIYRTIGLLAERAEVSDDGRIADIGSGRLVSRFVTPFTLLYKRWNYVEKAPFFATFQDVRRALHV
jgi:hypothetical protein